MAGLPVRVQLLGYGSVWVATEERLKTPTTWSEVDDNPMIS
jgi:hypothetical protein